MCRYLTTNGLWPNEIVLTTITNHTILSLEVEQNIYANVVDFYILESRKNSENKNCHQSKRKWKKKSKENKNEKKWKEKEKEKVYKKRNF